jgi:mannitol/fructose-specific phosphotransferase system IIA component (Ntr-type)
MREIDGAVPYSVPCRPHSRVGLRLVFLIDLGVRMPTTQTTKINQLLVPERVRIGLSETTKSDAINALVDLLKGHGAISSLETVRTAVFDREKKMSTGVGKGLGLPHAKTAAASDTVAAFATTEAPVDFGAVDDVPVQILLLLVGPEEHKSQHVKILGRISRLVSRDALRERLLEAETPETIIKTIREGEAALRS